MPPEVASTLTSPSDHFPPTNRTKILKNTLIVVVALSAIVMGVGVLTYFLNGNFQTFVNSQANVMHQGLKSSFSWIQSNGIPGIKSAFLHPLSFKEAVLYIALPSAIALSLGGGGYYFLKGRSEQPS